MCGYFLENNDVEQPKFRTDHFPRTNSLKYRTVRTFLMPPTSCRKNIRVSPDKTVTKISKR